MIIDRLETQALRILCVSMLLQASQYAFGNELEFFENKIRPVLVAECYECHSDQKIKAGLRLDFKGGIDEGGDSGALIDFKNPENSLLIKVLRHEIEDLEMPKDGAKIDSGVVDDFVFWISKGAQDPRVRAPEFNKEENKQEDNWKATLEFRKSWWSFQEVSKPQVPSVDNQGWSWNSVDKFLQSSWEGKNFEEPKDASLEIIARRLYLVLTGLPPSQNDIERFVELGSNNRQEAIENTVDQLLSSDRFGEKWARHWMDWFRYAGTHGSEGDPAIPEAWRYRDYLIRAWNEDVPYDQLVREHIAGDLLENPRINEELGVVESSFGPGQYRMVLHGFAPTDALDELVRFTDNQIDTIFKSMQGLTVSCARCHNHKFDPISQEDFYGLFGVMASTRPALVTVNSPENKYKNFEKLNQIKKSIKSKLIANWQNNLRDLLEDKPKAVAILSDWSKEHKSLLQPGFVFKQILQEKDQDKRLMLWKGFQAEIEESKEKVNQRYVVNDGFPVWDFENTSQTNGDWFKDGPSLENGAAKNGAFAIDLDGDGILQGVYPAGYYSHLISTKHRGLFESPKFRVMGGRVFLRVQGQRNASARYVIQNYPRNGTVYPTMRINNLDARWMNQNLNYWEGDDAHIEIATSADQPVLARVNESRSWFGVTDVILVPDGKPTPRDEAYEFSGPLFSHGNKSIEPARDIKTLAGHYLTTISSILSKWSSESESISSNEARFLAEFIGSELLPNNRNQDIELNALVGNYRKLESQIPLPIRAPGVVEGTPLEQSLMVRGNHKKLGQVVPRRFLEVFGAKKFTSKNSGRLELAEAILDPSNTLTSRVIVNRLWHYIFGKGIVATPDNFGRLGEKPSHPKLLDYLANEIQNSRWSMKSVIRQLVTSRSFQLTSSGSPANLKKDPGNKYLTRFNVRRLDAESIRDSILESSDNLDETMYGPPAGNDSNRRSIYLRVVRNRLHPFLSSFDFTAPFVTLGAREITNVPAQSLQMMNSPFVISASQKLADGARGLSGEPSTHNLSVVNRIFLNVLKRRPTDNEVKMTVDWLDSRKELAKSIEITSQKIKAEISNLNQRIEDIHKLALDEYSKSSEVKPIEESIPIPEPLVVWDFSSDKGWKTSENPLDLTGDVQVVDGVLVLDGTGYAKSQVFPNRVREKTLSALISIQDTNQRSGGVVTVENGSGGVFDSIVYAERQAKKWMAGSEHLKRSQDVGGPDEKPSESSSPLHLAITYGSDGKISIYRNGIPYGKSYNSGPPVVYESNDWRVVLGLRHSPDSPQKRFRGKIHMASVFDKVLSPEQIRFIGNGDSSYFILKNSLEALPEHKKLQLDNLKTKLKLCSAQLRELEKQIGQHPDPIRDLAQSLLNTKEFLFLY